MPELYAALTDLVAVEADAAAPPPRLPVLERLLARADRRAAPADWRRWALGVAGLAADGPLPIARTLAAAHAPAIAAAGSWFVATPVHLVAGLSRVHLHPAGPLTLAPAVAAALVQRFATSFGAADVALLGHPAGLLLRVDAVLAADAPDPAGYAGREVRDAAPSGADAGRLARLVTELQMWLHAAPPVSLQGLAVNGLWLWGGGAGSIAGRARWPRLGLDDAFLAAVAGAGEGERADAHLVCWRSAGLARAGRPFTDLDAEWARPLERALADGSLTAATLHLGASAYRLQRRQRLRWWRRTRPWWELAP